MTNAYVFYDVIFQKTTACNIHQQKQVESTNLDDTKVETEPGPPSSLQTGAELLHQDIVTTEVQCDFDGLI